MNDLVNIINSESRPVLAPHPLWAQDMGMDWVQRELYVCGEIDSDDAERFTVLVRQLEASAAPFRVLINTPGGDVGAMHTFVDLIRSSPCPVETVGVGEVCSAGNLMLACGDWRRVTENCVFMAHEYTLDGGELGYRAGKDRRKLHDWLHVRWAELMARYTERDEAWWKRQVAAGELWLLGGQAMVDVGLADEVIPFGGRAVLDAIHSREGFVKRVYPGEVSES